MNRRSLKRQREGLTDVEAQTLAGLVRQYEPSRGTPADQ